MGLHCTEKQMTAAEVQVTAGKMADHSRVQRIHIPDDCSHFCTLLSCAHCASREGYTPKERQKSRAVHVMRDARSSQELGCFEREIDVLLFKDDDLFFIVCVCGGGYVLMGAGVYRSRTGCQIPWRYRQL